MENKTQNLQTVLAFFAPETRTPGGEADLGAAWDSYVSGIEAMGIGDCVELYRPHRTGLSADDKRKAERY